jgi:hypothetical protein
VGILLKFKPPFSVDNLEPEVFFDELLQEKKPYHFKFLNWQNTEVKRGGKGIFCLIKSESLEDYPELFLKKGQIFVLHVSILSFQKAWNRAIKYAHLHETLKNLDEKEIYFVECLIQRINKFVVKISDIKIIKFEGLEK